MTEGALQSSTGSEAPDSSLERLAGRKDDWVRTGLSPRIRFLESCLRGVHSVAASWAGDVSHNQGIDPASALTGEAWLSGPMVTAEAIRQYIRALRRGGQPPPNGLRQAVNGQTIADVFPQNPIERFLYYNISAEIWIEPGCKPTQGKIYREKARGEYPPGRVALVLGGGNVSSIAPLDLLYKLFVEDQVVVLKMHPVNAYLGPHFERAFESLIRAGFLAVVYGGGEVGQALSEHPLVDTIHLTGSDRTHDAIVWGAVPEEQSARKLTGERLNSRPISSELGCVTPILVVPGDWSSSEIEYQARHVAGMVAHNASFNCNAGKVLVLAEGWPQRQVFLDRLRRTLAETAPRLAYYPGALDRFREFRETYPQAELLGATGEGVVPWTLIPEVPVRSGEPALTREAFCGVLAQVSIDATEPPEFLERSVELCNEILWGTLSCVILVDGKTRRRHSSRVERAIAELRYGGIGLNVWTGVNYGLPWASWGAFPGHTPERIVSGSGVVHNALLFDHPQKSVVRSRFRIFPKPIWFADHRTLDVVGRHLATFAATRSPWALLQLALAGLRG